MISAWVGFSSGLPGTGSITQVSVSLTVSCARRLVEDVGEDRVPGLDDDLGRPVELQQSGERLAVGHPVTGEGEVADLSRPRGRGVVPDPLGQEAQVGALRGSASRNRCRTSGCAAGRSRHRAVVSSRRVDWRRRRSSPAPLLGPLVAQPGAFGRRRPAARRRSCRSTGRPPSPGSRARRRRAGSRPRSADVVADAVAGRPAAGGGPGCIGRPRPGRRRVGHVGHCANF